MRVKTAYCSVDEEYYTELQAYANTKNQIYICIEIPGGDIREIQSIVLDRKTAIRLAKDLRREISLMEDES
jgi:hypothetical protein